MLEFFFSFIHHLSCFNVFFQFCLLCMNFILYHYFHVAMAIDFYYNFYFNCHKSIQCLLQYQAQQTCLVLFFTSSHKHVFFFSAWLLIFFFTYLVISCSICLIIKTCIHLMQFLLTLSLNSFFVCRITSKCRNLTHKPQISRAPIWLQVAVGCVLTSLKFFFYHSWFIVLDHVAGCCQSWFVKKFKDSLWLPLSKYLFETISVYIYIFYFF